MAAHLHWALLLSARSGAGSAVSLAEAQMRATPGGADLCTGGTASGASTGGQVAANAFDDNDATIWHGSTGGTVVRLSYQFASAVDVAEVFVRNAAASGSGTGYPGATFGPAACWIQWSDDGVIWRFGGPATDLSGLGNAAAATISGVSDQPPGARRVGAPVRFSPGAAASGLNSRRVGGALRYDSADGGPTRLDGFVKIDGTPATGVRRRVRVFDVASGRLVRQGWSNLDGSISFEKLRAAEWLLVTDDHTRVYNAVAADKVASVP